MKIRKFLLGCLWALVGVPFLSSLFLYFIQGGFGGGHGRFDEPIFLLAWPWAYLPLPHIFYAADFIWLILIPFALNSAIASAITFFVLRSKVATCEA